MLKDNSELKLSLSHASPDLSVMRSHGHSMECPVFCGESSQESAIILPLFPMILCLLYFLYL